MKDCLKISQINKVNNKIEYIYEYEGKWREILLQNTNMFVEYYENIENVPDSIAVIPFLCNILPISWVFDLEIRVEVLDENFLNCIENVKKGYIDMYPKIAMLGNLRVEKVEKNNYTSKKSGVLFSGGIDAFNTLFNHIDEKPILLTAWGSDIPLKDITGWEKVKEYHIELAKKFGLEASFVKSNFRDFFNYGVLTEYISKRINGEWWHEFQHGIGLIGLFAPLSYINNISTLYIASSFNVNDKGKYTCASDPTIDNYLKFCSCNVIHDGYEYTRQDKIANICRYLEYNKDKSITVRVCWQSLGGENCCECEKCYRTILGILAQKNDPSKFGFNLTDKKRSKMMKKLPKYVKNNTYNMYSNIQERFLENYTVMDTPKDLMWFRKIKIKTRESIFILMYKNTILRIKRVVKKILKLLHLR